MENINQLIQPANTPPQTVATPYSDLSTVSSLLSVLHSKGTADVQINIMQFKEKSQIPSMKHWFLLILSQVFLGLGTIKNATE